MNDQFNIELLEATERDALTAADSAIPAAPERSRLLAAAYGADEPTKESRMISNPIFRLFAGKNPAMRLALGGALLVALLALSLVLPRSGSISPVGTAWAAAEGYMLAFDFGEGSTQEQVQPVLDQLHAAVKAFKAKHNIPVDKAHKFGTHAEKRVMKRIERHGAGPGTGTESTEEKSRVVAMIALPDASLLDELQAELATIPGLPAPTQTDATWFTENGLPDPDKPGIHLALSFDDKGGAAHMFYFPESATEAQIESEIADWLAANKPEFKGEVDVTLKRDGERLELGVRINSKPSETTVDLKGLQPSGTGA